MVVNIFTTTSIFLRRFILFVSVFRVGLSVVCLWILTFILVLFSIPSQEGQGLVEKPENTAVIANIASEDIYARVHQLAQEEGYSYILKTSSDLSLGVLYDPADRYLIPADLRQSLEEGKYLLKEGLGATQQVEETAQGDIQTFNVSGAGLDLLPDFIVPLSLSSQSIYYEIMISADQALNGEELAEQISASAGFIGSLEEIQSPDYNWLMYGIYLLALLLVFLFYLYSLNKNARVGQVSLKAEEALGRSYFQQGRKPVQGSLGISLIVLIVCLLLTYLYQFTPYAKHLHAQSSYSLALVLTFLLLGLVCAVSSLLVSAYRSRVGRQKAIL